MNVFVLDACALIAYLRNEEGREKLLNLFDTANDSEIKVVMHAANFAEVYYDFWRVSDKTTANQILPTFLFCQLN
ncbi:MAG: PIN domain-containing protein [Segetibacter sp.]